MSTEYHVTTTVDGRVIGIFQMPIQDPFVNTSVTIGWRDAAKAFFRFKRIKIVVVVGGSRQAIQWFFHREKK